MHFARTCFSPCKFRNVLCISYRKQLVDRRLRSHYRVSNYETRSANISTQEKASVILSKNDSAISKEVKFAERAKQVTKDATHFTVLVLSIGTFGVIVYYLLKELFSRETPNGIYREATKICLKNSELSSALGSSIRVHGERGNRGRARHPRVVEYMEESKRNMIVQFYMEGSQNLAVVQAHVEKDDRNKYQFKEIIAQLTHPFKGKWIISVVTAQK